MIKKYRLMILVVCLAFFAVTLLPGGCEKEDKDDSSLALFAYKASTEDTHEPDNDTDEADDQGLFPPNAIFTGTSWDIDGYAINVPAGQLHVTVTLTFTHAEGNLDMELIDYLGALQGTGYSVTDNETIDTTVPAAGTHYILIANMDLIPAGSGQNYDLMWTHQP